MIEWASPVKNFEFPLWKVLYYINIIIIIIIINIITECADILVSHNGSWKSCHSSNKTLSLTLSSFSGGF